MRKVLTILLVGALLLAMIPVAVYAAAGGVTGSGKGGNTAPDVTAVQLEDDLGAEVIAMTPLSQYYVTATVGDVNTIDDIAYIEFYVYHTSSGANWDADQNAIFKWTKSGDVWSMENGGASTTWEITTIDCVTPSVFTVTSDDWTLAFKLGKLAQADASANWFVSAKAYDENKNHELAWATGSTVAAYSAVAFNQGTITLGDATAGIEPGDTGYITDPVANYITVQVTTNDEYALGVHSEATWDDGGSNTITLAEQTGVPSGSGEFAMEIDNEELGDPGEPKTPQAVMDDSPGAVTITGMAAVGRVTVDQGAGEGTNDHDMYMSLSFATAGIQEVTYSGDITFTVTN